MYTRIGRVWQPSHGILHNPTTHPFGIQLIRLVLIWIVRQKNTGIPADPAGIEGVRVRPRVLFVFHKTIV